MGKIVKVHNVNKASTPLVINGRRVEIPHNTDFPLADNYVSLLEDTHLNYTIIDDIADEKSAGYVADGADESGPGGSILSSADPLTQQVPGGDSLPRPDHDPADGLPIVTAAPEINQVPGGDNLTTPVANDLEQREAAGREQAIERRQQAEDGTQPPVVVLRNDDPEQTGTASNETVEGEAQEPGPLDQAIPALTEHLETITDDDEIDKLIAAETAGKSRSGALAALEARKEVLASA